MNGFREFDTPMPTKRAIFSALTHGELRDNVDRYGLDVHDRRPEVATRRRPGNSRGTAWSCGVRKLRELEGERATAEARGTATGPSWSWGTATDGVLPQGRQPDGSTKILVQ